MFSYIGGKSTIGKWVKEYIPNDIKIYVEPFSGAFWVYFNMDLTKYPNLEKVVYNDSNPVNANLFNSVKTPEDFYNFIKNEEVQQKNSDKEGMLSDKKLINKFYEYQTSSFDGRKLDLDNPDFQWAMEYVYVITQVFSGSKPETSKFIDLKHKYRSKFDTFKDKMGGIGRGKLFPMYLKGITNVENMDFQEVIEKYDSRYTYFYCDPPYWKTENYYSNHDFDRNDHERLAKCLQQVQGRWSLSYYDFELLSQWFPKDEYHWVSKSFAKAASAKKGEKQNLGEELLIMNYE